VEGYFIMAVAYFYENPEMTVELMTRAGELVNAQLGEQRPSGQIYHANGQLEGDGVWAFEVWESTADADRFWTDVITPIGAQIGASLGQRRQLAVLWHSEELPPNEARE
jgi:hypothetical protein